MRVFQIEQAKKPDIKIDELFLERKVATFQLINLKVLNRGAEIEVQNKKLSKKKNNSNVKEYIQIKAPFFDL